MQLDIMISQRSKKHKTQKQQKHPIISWDIVIFRVRFFPV